MNGNTVLKWRVAKVLALWRPFVVGQPAMTGAVLQLTSKGASWYGDAQLLTYSLRHLEEKIAR
jgi:hypothetical protein